MFAFITYVLYHAVHMQHHYLRNLGVLRHITRCDLELLKWQIAWLLHWECSGLAHMSFKEILLTIESEIFQANLMGLCYWVDGVTTSSLFSARFRPTKSYFLHEDMQLNNNKAPFQNLILAFHEVPDEVGVELCNQLGTTIKHIWSSQFLEYLTGSEHGSTFQEPSLLYSQCRYILSTHSCFGILVWGILGFGDRDCAQVETTCGRNGTSALPYVDQAGVNNVYYLDMPYYFERVYADQDCYIILSEVQTEMATSAPSYYFAQAYATTRVNSQILMYHGILVVRHGIVLRSSQNLRERDCQRPPLLHSWAGLGATALGPVLPEDTNSNYLCEGDGQKRVGLELNGLDGGFGRGLAWPACVACPFLPP
jgi:hypothetical protein